MYQQVERYRAVMALLFMFGTDIHHFKDFYVSCSNVKVTVTFNNVAVGGLLFYKQTSCYSFFQGAIIGIDDEDDSTFTITVDHKTFHFQGKL